MSSSRADPTHVEQLGKFSTCEISDALFKLKLPSGYLADVESFGTGDGDSVVGEAYTVKMVDQRDMEAPKLSGHFVDLAPSGAVMVISSPPHVKSASFGGLLGAGASVKGVKAVVIDGRCRDLAELRELKLPVFARGHSTLGQSPYTRASEIQVSIKVAAQFPKPSTSTNGTTPAPEWPEVTVNPYDLVVADTDGVVVVPADKVADVLQAAQQGKEVDDKCREAILKGMPVQEAFNTFRGNTKKH